MRGIVGEDDIFVDPLPKIAFIGRSNVGKSSLINALIGPGIAHGKGASRELARTSPKPGYTRQINVSLINDSFHLVDLPGYGFATGSKASREQMGDLIHSYLFNPNYEQEKVVMIIDANIGLTDKDMSMFHELAHFPKNFIVVANKIDKMNQSEYHHKLAEIKVIAGAHPVFPVSATKKTGLDTLTTELFG